MTLFKKIMGGILCLPVFTIVCAQNDTRVTFDHPATRFEEACPIGNGRLGCLVFGNPNEDRIILNENSMWSGSIQDPNKDSAYLYFKPIQQLLLDGKNAAAQKMLQEHFVAEGAGSGSGNGANVPYGSYQMMANLFLRFKHSGYTNYKRALSLDSAISYSSWIYKEVQYKEIVYSSAPANAIVIQLTASKAKALSFELLLDREQHLDKKTIDNDNISISGFLPDGKGGVGIQYATLASIKSQDGRIVKTDSSLRIVDATRCTLVITGATDMNWPNVETRGSNPVSTVKLQYRKISSISNLELVQQHVKDYQSYFNRCRLLLQGNTNKAFTSTQQRLIAFQNGNYDPTLAALYFNFGRYLLISSSRAGSLPTNLQGLWVDGYNAPWNGDYHLNINIQMNYWPAEITGLASNHLPIFSLLQQMSQYGKETAKKYYNSDGWVAHVITNPWGFTAPGESAEWGSTLTGGAWLTMDILQHYEYTGDKSFLKKYYPILKGAAQFYTHILVEEPQHHWLVTAPSNSPENAYKLPNGTVLQTAMGPTIDMQIGRQLLLENIKAATILELDKNWSDSLENIVGRLAPNQISPRTGAIQEWLDDYAETDVHHRHVSHLYGVYPYDEINPIQTPELVKAARVTLERRGDEGTGWSRAWKIAFWARLGDGNHAFKMLKALLSPAVSPDAKRDGPGTYPNLFCAHPPFQIDGNLGAVAGIAEMLVHSYSGDTPMVQLLPALPTDENFKNGSVKGLHLKGGFILDMSWENSRLRTFSISATEDRNVKLLLPENIVRQQTIPQKEMVLRLKKGQHYSYPLKK
ncbi:MULTISPECIES: glycosyl hydrolase family 95 catalytic domain-containing protein [Chitinophagaceae]